jgi:hypothetical protein
MKKRIKLYIECGDINYVKPGEYFATLSPDGKTIVSLQQRQDDLSMKTIVSTPVPTEEKTVSKSLASLKAGDSFNVTPTSGKTMSKVTVTISA